MALSWFEGDWKAGRESSDRSLELSPLNTLHLTFRVLLEHEAGEFAQGDVYLGRLLQAMERAGPNPVDLPSASLAITMIARITGVPDRLEKAEVAAEATLSNQAVTPFAAILARASLALLAVHKGDQAVAKEHYAYLLGQRGTSMLYSSVDRLLGLLAQTMGNLELAAEHFEDALVFLRKSGYRPELAWTCCDYADMLHERHGDGDRAKAVSLLEESLTLSNELGMRPLMERVLSRREILGA